MFYLWHVAHITFMVTMQGIDSQHHYSNHGHAITQVVRRQLLATKAVMEQVKL